MEIFLGIVAIAALLLVAIPAPAIWKRHQIDVALKKFDLSVRQFAYSMGKVQVAFTGTAEALRKFSEAVMASGGSVTHENSYRAG